MTPNDNDVQVCKFVVRFQYAIEPGTPVLDVEPLAKEDIGDAPMMEVEQDGVPYWYGWAEIDGRRTKCLIPRRVT